ncbi:MAG: glycyl-radical enzyme activating protein [Spirochaetes bacterium]|nr:glycyl-radical enzyme activating protein [Spirochaetota bacterium]
MQRGIVFNIQRFSIHDGPGIRTTVFFKGCPLSCVWCHNPESISPSVEISFNERLCTLCGACAGVCPHGAHKVENGSHRFERTVCERCGRCAQACVSEALTIVGEWMSAEEVLAEVERDLPFYETSKGGMTLSGGEPLLQADFAAELLRLARERGIHTCLDTSGYVQPATLERIRAHVDLFLFDFKGADPDRHKNHTGVDCDLILKNLALLVGCGERVILRCPIVPGYTDSEEHFSDIAGLEKQYPDLVEIDILGYHELGEGKYERLGRYSPMCRQESVDENKKKQWLERLYSLGCRKATLG